jgi:hypothetical protein
MHKTEILAAHLFLLRRLYAPGLCMESTGRFMFESRWAPDRCASFLFLQEAL